MGVLSVVLVVVVVLLLGVHVKVAVARCWSAAWVFEQCWISAWACSTTLCIFVSMQRITMHAHGQLYTMFKNKSVSCTASIYRYLNRHGAGMWFNGCMVHLHMVHNPCMQGMLITPHS